jgi:OTU domain-containing protein 5
MRVILPFHTKGSEPVDDYFNHPPENSLNHSENSIEEEEDGDLSSSASNDSSSTVSTEFSTIEDEEGEGEEDDHETVSAPIVRTSVGKSSDSTIKEKAVPASIEEERKLPASSSTSRSSSRQQTRVSRKRKRPKQSSVDKKHTSADAENKKLPVKKTMTAGRYADDEREPPPSEALEKNTTSLTCAVDDPALQEDKLLEEQFIESLKSRGLEIQKQEGDGNCLFRAVSYQVYGDSNMHMDVRQQCLDHISKDKEHFSQFVEGEEFSAYIERKRQEGVHGNNPEIQAISELFNRPVEVFTPATGAKPINIFQSEYKTSDVPIRLCYHDNHYDAVIDPLLPTAGLGLGLPGLQPGLADKMQIDKAVRESDQLADEKEYEKALEESYNDQLQRAIKDSSLAADQMYSDKAMALSDLEATDFDLEQAVLESSLDAFRKQEMGRKQRATDGPASLVASIPPAAAAAAMPVASVAAAAASVPTPDPPFAVTASATDEYPPTVQELVMNGFELSKVIHAYELFGDNFDELLCFLMSAST